MSFPRYICESQRYRAVETKGAGLVIEQFTKDAMGKDAWTSHLTCDSRVAVLELLTSLKARAERAEANVEELGGVVGMEAFDR